MLQPSLDILTMMKTLAAWGVPVRNKRVAEEEDFKFRSVFLPFAVTVTCGGLTAYTELVQDESEKIASPTSD